MNRLVLGLVVAAATVSLFAQTDVEAPPSGPEDQKKSSVTNDRLVGTWKLVSAKYGGRTSDVPERYTMLKHITPTQFMWVSYDDEGVVRRAAGGEYTLNSGKYAEMPHYGLSADFDIIKGKPQQFDCRIDGETWHHKGELSNGLTIEEVWKRVAREPDA
ncbi:MAG: hypothetical protein M3552_13255 [Planctomycetota bacterium]|nr:hypothetical protein [Planctomycetaceae bacterium]MDQ3331600.1 hypothetical protein [Planctomycetota bacterium]